MRIMLATLLAAAVAVPAQAGARQEATVLLPDHPQAKKFLEDWGFSEAVVVGDTVYMSGVVVGLMPEEKDLQAAYTRTFEIIGQILKRAGASWDDVVDITSYHTDLTTQLSVMRDVKNKYVKAPFPAWTAIGVSRLLPDRGLTEIKIVAKLPKKR